MKIVSLLLFLSSIFSMVEAKTVFEFNDCKVMTSKDKKTLVFPVVDAEKRQIRLHLTARFDWKSLSGYTFGMKIFVNGKDITGVRLLNKPLAFKTRSGGGTYWSFWPPWSWAALPGPATACWLPSWAIPAWRHWTV